MRFNDLTGLRFSRLVAISATEEKSGGKTVWRFMCDCGTEVSVRGSHVTGGRTRSCGCLEREEWIKRRTSHGMANTRPYRIWRDMINRCHYEKYPERHLYGGRGISVCDSWRNSFEAFFADMGMPDDDKSIDRIDVNGNYEPGNCRWATAKEQSANKRVRVAA